MRIVRSMASLMVASLLLPATSAMAQQIQLSTVVSGLASPVFVGNAGDSLNRLFIVERAGVIKVLQPGESTPTDFLDIRTKIVSGGEQGLLGLAFHPQYSTNGRLLHAHRRRHVSDLRVPGRRAGELYVVHLGGSVSRVVQAAACTYSISPARATYGPGGATGTVAVTADGGCAWTATSNASWLTVSGGASGSGNGTVMYSVAVYTGRPKNRNGTITIAGQTFSVKQSK